MIAKEKKERWVELHEAGMSAYQIALHEGVSWATVVAYLTKAAKYKAAQRGPKPEVQRHPQWYKRAVRLRKQGWTLAEIAYEYGVSKQRVHQLMKENGVVPPKKSRTKKF